MKILLVDDDEDFIKTMCRFLTDRGHVLGTARDGEQAMRSIETENLELVITDIQMPNMDGVELLQRIRERFADLPVVVLTGYSDASRLAAAFQYGAYGYLEKPVNLEALLAGIRRLDRSKAESTDSAAALSQEDDHRRASVLIVDDQPGIREVARQALSQYTVLEAASGEEALAVLAREKVDLVITDIRMPAMSGVELRRVLADQAPGVPVLAMSGYATAEELEGCGFDDVIEKPIGLEALRKMIAGALESCSP